MTAAHSWSTPIFPPTEVSHAVHFFDSDDTLAARVAGFLGEGLADGQSAIMIATAPHRLLTVNVLRGMNIDVGTAVAAGRLTLLDAHETLSRLIVGGMPDEDRFRDVVGAAVDAATAGGGGRVRARAFGEMVDILWRDGNQPAALRLEELWNRLGAQYPFDLLCGYSMASFQDGADSAGVRAICDRHGLVVATPEPAVSVAGAGSDRRSEATRALAAEIAYRKSVEHSLRQALSDLRQSEERERERAAAERRARQEAEAQLHVSQSLAAAMAENVRMNDLLVGVLAHDLRSPLAAVVTAAELLKARESVLANGRNGRALDRVIVSAHRMARMIDQLLDFTRLRVGGGIAIEARPADLAALVRQVTDELEVTHGSNQVTIEQVGDVKGAWDPDRLSQVLQNLIGNALQHGVAGSGVRVLVDGSGATRLQVRVHNQGYIPAELIPRVFQPLTGGKSRRRDRARGLGLGLFISQRIAEAHGGDVAVASSDAEGTTFTVTLPRLTAGASSAAVAAGAAKPVFGDGATMARAAVGAHKKLRESEARFRLLVEAVKDYAIFMLDPTGHVMTWNAGAQRIKGYTASEIIGQHFSRFYEDDEIRSGKCEYELKMAGREGRFEDEGWRLRKDGTRFWANVVITALRDPEGELVGFAKVTRDLTERRRLEIEQLRLAKAEEAIRLRDEFLSLAAHELKTPLTVLQMQLDTLNERMDDSDQRLGVKLARATQSSERLGSLIESLLDVSRIATGRFALEPRPFDMSECVARIADSLRATAERAGCALIVDGGAPIVGCWDRLRIEQVLTNLLANAIKYGAGHPVLIAVGQQPGDGADNQGWVTLEVRDHGPGIPDTERRRIFGRFERAASIRNYGGLGLGLYLIQEIVNAHDGTVSVENAPDGGARFVIRLPLRVGLDVAPTAAAIQPIDVN